MAGLLARWAGTWSSRVRVDKTWAVLMGLALRSWACAWEPCHALGGNSCHWHRGSVTTPFYRQTSTEQGRCLLLVALLVIAEVGI